MSKDVYISTVWSVHERLATVRVETPGQKSEAWVELIGTDGTQIAFPLSVLFQATAHVQASLTNLIEDSRDGFMCEISPGTED